MKESRLFKIVYHLLEKGHVTAPELAKEFEVSSRTIYRDIDALSGAGIPVYAETGRNGGIYLLEDFVLDKTLLSEHEKIEILSALQSLSVVGNTYEKEILTKLSALFQMQAENWFEVDFTRWGGHTKDDSKFDILKYAVIHHKTVSMVYVNAYGVRSKREINPLKMLYKSKEWYIKAYCTDKENYRIFKFNRIVEIELTDKEFTPKTFPEVQSGHSSKYNKIILRFPKEMAYRVFDEFEASEVEELEHGVLVAAAEMPEDAWLIGYLLSFGSQVEVLEPLYLRKILAEEAKKVYEMNKT